MHFVGYLYIFGTVLKCWFSKEKRTFFD